jgi:hypothetical protein
MFGTPNLDSIPFGRPFVVGKELYYIAKAVEHGGLAGDQVFTKLCHRWLESGWVPSARYSPIPARPHWKWRRF